MVLAQSPQQQQTQQIIRLPQHPLPQQILMQQVAGSSQPTLLAPPPSSTSNIQTVLPQQQQQQTTFFPSTNISQAIGGGGQAAAAIASAVQIQQQQAVDILPSYGGNGVVIDGTAITNTQVQQNLEQQTTTTLSQLVSAMPSSSSSQDQPLLPPSGQLHQEQTVNYTRHNQEDLLLTSNIGGTTSNATQFLQKSSSMVAFEESVVVASSNSSTSLQDQQGGGGWIKEPIFDVDHTADGTAAVALHIDEDNLTAANDQLLQQTVEDSAPLLEELESSVDEVKHLADMHHFHTNSALNHFEVAAHESLEPPEQLLDEEIEPLEEEEAIASNFESMVNENFSSSIPIQENEPQRNTNDNFEDVNENVDNSCIEKGSHEPEDGETSHVPHEELDEENNEDNREDEEAREEKESNLPTPTRAVLPGMIMPSGLMSLSSAANIFRTESMSSKNSSR